MEGKRGGVWGREGDVEETLGGGWMGEGISVSHDIFSPLNLAVKRSVV